MATEKIIQIDVEGIMIVALTNRGNVWVRKQSDKGEAAWFKLDLPDMEQAWIEPDARPKKRRSKK